MTTTTAADRVAHNLRLTQEADTNFNNRDYEGFLIEDTLLT